MNVFGAFSSVCCLKRSEDKQTVSRIGGIYSYFVFLNQTVLGMHKLGGGGGGWWCCRTCSTPAGRNAYNILSENVKGRHHNIGMRIILECILFLYQFSFFKQ